MDQTQKKLWVVDEAQKKMWIADALRKATPTARRWAAHRIKNGDKFEDFEEEFLEVIVIEDRLYNQMKETLCHHISLRGLGEASKPFFDDVVAVKMYNRNQYAKILKKIRKAFVNDGDNRDLKYLIAKINEYISKVQNLSHVGYEMLIEGKSPDFEVWSDKAALSDAVFEENKQFLKQTLNHLDVLNRNRVKMGTDEIRLLLYNKDGCRREKLYRQAELWIIKIYNALPSDDLRRSVYREICEFIADVVPLTGYISPSMIAFIFDRDFLSSVSRDLLVKIKPIITTLGMTALITHPLLEMYAVTAEHIEDDFVTESDGYVMELMYLYAAKRIDAATELKWHSIVKRRQGLFNI